MDPCVFEKATLVMLTTLHLLPRDAQCGTLQCQGGEPNPMVPHMAPVESTARFDGHEVACRAALVLPDAQLDPLDLGLVEPGTHCGPGMVSPAHSTPPGHLSSIGKSVTSLPSGHTAHRCAKTDTARTLPPRSWSAA